LNAAIRSLQQAISASGDTSACSDSLGRFSAVTVCRADDRGLAYRRTRIQHVLDVARPDLVAWIYIIFHARILEERINARAIAMSPQAGATLDDQLTCNCPPRPSPPLTSCAL
jgi:hypothetical protein